MRSIVAEDRVWRAADRGSFASASVFDRAASAAAAASAAGLPSVESEMRSYGNLIRHRA